MHVRCRFIHVIFGSGPLSAFRGGAVAVNFSPQRFEVLGIAMRCSPQRRRRCVTDTDTLTCNHHDHLEGRRGGMDESETSVFGGLTLSRLTATGNVTSLFDSFRRK